MNVQFASTRFKRMNHLTCRVNSCYSTDLLSLTVIINNSTTTRLNNRRTWPLIPSAPHPLAHDLTTYGCGTVRLWYAVFSSRSPCLNCSFASLKGNARNANVHKSQQKPTKLAWLQPRKTSPLSTLTLTCYVLDHGPPPSKVFLPGLSYRYG